MKKDQHPSGMVFFAVVWAVLLLIVGYDMYKQITSTEVGSLRFHLDKTSELFNGSP